MTSEQTSALRADLAALLGDPAAVDFCMSLMGLIHAWDDLVDRDKPLEPQVINRAFLTALVDLPLNPFYHRHVQALAPVLINAFLQWRDANTMEQAEIPTEKDLNLAFVLRASVFQVFVFCAFLIGGIELSREIGPDIRRLYVEHLEEYKEEIRQCRM